MIGFLGGAYLWVKAAHIIFVIFWMAGLFMLPRFLAYHQEADPASPEQVIWVERERRLIRIILNPSMIMVWLLGFALAIDVGAFDKLWFQLKLVFVLGLSGYHGWMSAYSRKLVKDMPTVSSKALRMLNEVPGVATAVVVILVIVRPF